MPSWHKGATASLSRQPARILLSLGPLILRGVGATEIFIFASEGVECEGLRIVPFPNTSLPDDRSGCEVPMMAPLGAYDGGKRRPAGDWVPFTVHLGRACCAWSEELVGRGEAAMLPTSRTAMMRILPRTALKKMLSAKAYDGLFPITSILSDGLEFGERCI